LLTTTADDPRGHPFLVLGHLPCFWPLSSVACFLMKKSVIPRTRPSPFFTLLMIFPIPGRVFFPSPPPSLVLFLHLILVFRVLSISPGASCGFYACLFPLLSFPLFTVHSGAPCPPLFAFDPFPGASLLSSFRDWFGRTLKGLRCVDLF